MHPCVLSAPFQVNLCRLECSGRLYHQRTCGTNRSVCMVNRDYGGVYLLTVNMRIIHINLISEDLHLLGFM